MRACTVLVRNAAEIAVSLGRLLFLALALGAGSVARAASLDPALLPEVQAATFEVVAAKPVNDPLTYEKPLPLDLLPFQERNDKYYSVGTAFAIDANRYVTAAHVLVPAIGSLWGAPALRDSAGHVYPIDRIEKFSLARDFVVFSLARAVGSARLDVETKPKLNDVVYAVGNALGTGIVIRDGLYTSNTPEDQDGRWNWMRFSAAASPGNSGGPLLDKSGKVIGVVLMKSPSENLNYALPIAQVLDAPEHVAEIDNRLTYRLDLFDATRTENFKADFALPVDFAAFSATFQRLRNAFADTQLKALLAQEKDNTFPHGTGSARLLHDVPGLSSAPALILRKPNGDWGLSPRTETRMQLPANGYIVPGIAGRTIMIHLRKPDDVPLRALYHDPQQLMRLMAKAGFFSRHVASEKVKVTALGPPSEDSVYTDGWQRRWQVRVWPLAYENLLVMTFSLPTPDGYATLMRFAPAGEEHDHLIDMRTLCDFFYAAYDGTLAQWKDYLAETGLLPAAFKGLRIEVDPGHRFAYASRRLSFAYGPDVQAIGPNNVLTLGLGYFDDHGKVMWDVGDVRVKRAAADRDWINIQRHVAPSPGLDDSYTSTWDKIRERRHPYDAVARNDRDQTQITAVAAAPDGPPPAVLYTAFVGVEGTAAPEAVKAKLDVLLKNLHVIEH